MHHGHHVEVVVGCDELAIFEGVDDDGWNGNILVRGRDSLAVWGQHVTIVSALPDHFLDHTVTGFNAALNHTRRI